MCTLTQRDLDFLASLPTRWHRLYWRELARILMGDAHEHEGCDDVRPLLSHIIVH
jgi:hypothetical protein